MVSYYPKKINLSLLLLVVYYFLLSKHHILSLHHPKIPECETKGNSILPAVITRVFTAR